MSLSLGWFVSGLAGADHARRERRVNGAGHEKARAMIVRPGHNFQMMM
jgi:hypothetical protein